VSVAGLARLPVLVVLAVFMVLFFQVRC